MNEVVSRQESVVGEPYLFVSRAEGTDNHYQVRGFYLGKLIYREQRCFVVESFTMFHLIPEDNIVQVQKEPRRFIW